jgi:hypothetical protein
VSTFELQTSTGINAWDAGFNTETSGDLDKFDAADHAANRATVWIPTEHVTVNVGAAIWGSSGQTENAPSSTSPPEVDAGIVAQTDGHIHFHTFGQAGTITVPNIEANPDPGLSDEIKAVVTEVAWLDPNPVQKNIAQARAVLRLGTPLKVVTAAGSYGANDANALQTPTGIGSGWPQPFDTWNGYAMITEGGSYQESWGNNVIVAGYGDFRAVGNRMVLIGSPGDVEIVADKTTVADLVSNDGDDSAQSNFVGTGKWARQKTGWIVFETINTIQSAAWGIVAAAETIYHAIYHRSPTPASCGWDAMSGMDWFTNLAGFASPLISIGVMAKGLNSTFSRDPNNDHGNISLYAAAGFSAYGQTTATLHAEISASVTSFLSTSVTANFSNAVSSDLLMAVSGTMTTVGGMMSVGVSSQFGTATVSAKKSVTVSSYGQVFVACKDELQLNSTDSMVYVHGRYGFYVGCGAGGPTPAPTGGTTYGNAQGWGIVGSNSGADQGGGGKLQIGRMTQGNVFRSPVPDAQVLITIQNSKMLLQHTEATIRMEHSDIYIGEKTGVGRVHIG